MPIWFTGMLERIEEYEGKSGYGANITISTQFNDEIRRIEFMTKDKKQVNNLKDFKLKTITVHLELNQNRFGMRLGDIIDIELSVA